MFEMLKYRVILFSLIIFHEVKNISLCLLLCIWSLSLSICTYTCVMFITHTYIHLHTYTIHVWDGILICCPYLRHQAWHIFVFLQEFSCTVPMTVFWMSFMLLYPDFLHFLLVTTLESIIETHLNLFSYSFFVFAFVLGSNTGPRAC
jgi:hypothetical protein